LILSFVTLAAFGFDTKARQAFLVDADTGAVLYEKNAQARMTPSSMSKLMTLYLVFERLKSGQLKLTDTFLVSEKAWRTQGSKMFLPHNASVSVEDLLRGVIVQSGNDASIVLAEGIAGSESDFAALMNAKAAELGLQHSHFVNSTGWPHSQHYMTAADIATLCLAIIKTFPEYYSYFAEKDFVFNNIKQPNRNTLLNTLHGVDGLKTGHTQVGKYGIAVSAVKDGRRLVAVVNGLKNDSERAAEATRLLQYGFLNFVNIVLLSSQKDLIEVPVLLGDNKKVRIGSKQDLIFTVPITFKGQNEVKLEYPCLLYAPVSLDKKVGQIEIKLYNGEVRNFDLYTLGRSNRLGIIKRFFVKTMMFFNGAKSDNVQSLVIKTFKV
jgi:D-alanyl-D-alanine carboxypeptidase (penicillin-binding protein 5/6)